MTKIDTTALRAMMAKLNGRTVRREDIDVFWKECVRVLPALLDLAESAKTAREDAIMECAGLLDVTNSAILLSGGEMTAQELRSVRAVLNWRKATILALLEKPQPAPHHHTHTPGASPCDEAILSEETWQELERSRD